MSWLKVGRVWNKIFFLLIVISFYKIQPTNSLFIDTEEIKGNTFAAGCWVGPNSPELSYPMDGYLVGKITAWNFNPYLDWEDTHAVCPGEGLVQYQIQISTNQAFTQIVFTSDWQDESKLTTPQMTEGTYWWRVKAKDGSDRESGWSEVWKLTIDLTPPVVKIVNLVDGDKIWGSKGIIGTVTDSHPHHYWFEIFNSSGARVAGLGTVNENEGLVNELLYKWDTTKVPDGTYVIKLEARDAAGNKVPDQSPVLNDPEEDNDSVDWVVVKVTNDESYELGDVLINEIMWMGSTAKSSDEWIELRNMTDEGIDLSGWVVVGLEETDHPLPLSGLLPSKNDQATNGYFLISSQAYDDNNSGLNVKQDLLVPALNLSNKAEQLILKDSHGNIVDRTSAATTPPSDWAAGSFDNGKEAFSKSMQRKEGTATAGHNAGSWGDCTHDVCNDGKYWDNSDGPDYGTPKDENKFAVLTVSSSSLKLDNGPKTSGLKIPDDLQLNSLSAVTPTPTPTPTVTPSVQDTELVEEIKGDGGSETTDGPQVTPTPIPTSSEQEINDENTNAINESATILNTTQTLKAPDETDSDIEVEPVEEEPTKEEEGGGDVPEEEPAIKEEEYEEEASEDSEDSGRDGDGESDEDSGTEENDDEPEEPSSESEGLE